MMSGVLSSSLFILCILVCFINHKGNTVAFGFTNVTDQQALLAIKDLIPKDPLKALSSWNASLHFCSWKGVKCGRKHQRVTALNMAGLRLQGFLSPHIGNLTFLREINLSTNNFHGTIPQEVGRLFRLRSLSLEYNSFQDELPRNLSHCSNLRVLIIGRNNFTGKIPSQLGTLHQLNELDLSENRFAGPIPSSFGNLSSLIFISLADNNLEGSIPTELGGLFKLEHLDLSVNNLSGMVPEQIFNLSSIYALGLVDNQLNGRLPFDLGLRLPNVQEIHLGLNQFSGPLPASITNASGIEGLDLAFNALTGPVPKNLGNLQNLKYINFGSNPLGDENETDLSFLTSLTNCTSLEEISLFENRLRGLLPNSIANLSTNLYWLSLPANYLTGAIPTEIGDLKNLQYLALAENMLTGRLPHSIGKLSMLNEFYVYSNKISGEIPSFFGNISGLLRLNLGKNLLEGTIPVSLVNCIHLEVLELTANNLTGIIPEEIFGLSSPTIGLFLDSNELTGPLPSQLGNMRKLTQLDISKNILSGEIPSTFQNFVMLETLNMEGNFFEGPIPSSIEKLRSIRVLDLSRNNFSGQIPEFLGELPLLENLNLSFNKFEGKVPSKGVFENASAFSVAGNSKLCGGINATQLPTCPNIREQYQFSRRVVILITIAALFILLLLGCIFAVIYRKRSPKRKPLLPSTSEKKYKQVSYGDLVRATDGFSPANMIGSGRYGTVYKGILISDVKPVAVKVLKLQQQGANRTFVAECEALRSVKHRNLVSVVTACLTIDFKGNDFKALIFEFMPNGSLESWLHPSSMDLRDSYKLSLLQRINILIDVALALDYLHNHCENPVVHCDLKPSNILLDNALTARVGDFGLARILSAATGESISQSVSTSSLCIRGTIGYVAPEYGMGGEVSIQGDVYSYGILLLEMFTGKRPTDKFFAAADNFNLHNYVKTALPDQVLEILDPVLTNDIQEAGQELSRTGPSSSSSSRGNIGKMESCLASIFQVGVQCSADLPSERMVVRDVVSNLNKIKIVLCSI